jgi:hypothetical protein
MTVTAVLQPSPRSSQLQYRTFKYVVTCAISTSTHGFDLSELHPWHRKICASFNWDNISEIRASPNMAKIRLWYNNILALLALELQCFHRSTRLLATPTLRELHRSEIDNR